MDWWQPRGVLRRFVVDLLADEMARHRRAAAPHATMWADYLRLDMDLDSDSLELMTLATALAESVHLHESGIEDYLLARRTLGEWVDITATGLARYSECLTFRTSGSSGTPKPCVHVLAALQQETRHLATLFPDRRRVLCAVPAHHIYGFLFSVLLPARLGLRAEKVIDLRSSTPAWLARGAQPGDLVIGFPDFWHAVGRTVPELPPGVVGVTSCAPCPDAVSQQVEDAGIERLVHVYGASETGGVGARDTHRKPYTLFPHWRLEGDHRLVRRLPDGGEQAAWVQDRLEMSGESLFRVGPRLDNGVQVGGINVFPVRVREVLKAHPAVDDVAVRLMRPEEGGRLKAFVVAKPGWDPHDILRELRELAERELAPAERPKAWRLGESLPKTPAGKMADWEP
ncbi:AMP-binding protein [Ramlibacter sp. PS3R-8]|uniref:AMP-binding enzyme n=1 Tax=Ramlibacter sp. PS3R-8 TaxID=3133437 RepID=UPI0030A56C0C